MLATIMLCDQSPIRYIPEYPRSRVLGESIRTGVGLLGVVEKYKYENMPSIGSTLCSARHKYELSMWGKGETDCMQVEEVQYRMSGWQWMHVRCIPMSGR